MAQLEILNKENKPVGKVDLPSDIFGVEVKKGVLHEVVRNYLANQRQGNAGNLTNRRVRAGQGREVTVHRCGKAGVQFLVLCQETIRINCRKR